MVTAYEKEESEAAKNTIGQILINSKMCAAKGGGSENKSKWDKLIFMNLNKEGLKTL
jgi:tartrate dehydratase alpha subunit/fumarate hydratase class I-like protein